MEEGGSKLPAAFGMDEDKKEEEKERLITRKRKRKGNPRRLVLCNEDFSISECFHQRPTEYFSNQEGLDLSRTRGEFLPYSLIISAGEDIIAKITSFCESCSCNAYIVSAVGSIARASILLCGNALMYEDPVVLSCSPVNDAMQWLLSGSYGIVSLTGYVSVSLTPGGNNGYKVLITLAGNNNSVFGGYVSGPLIAATNVQIVLWRFNHSPSEETSAQGSSCTVDSPETEMEVP